MTEWGLLERCLRYFRHGDEDKDVLLKDLEEWATGAEDKEHEIFG